MKKDNKSAPDILRQKAEKLLKKKPSKTGSQFSEAKTLKLIHELEVHQIELEMQNEELMVAKARAAELATEKYVELYDFAPSGYFTLSKEGKIIDLNLCGSQMLGKERSLLKNSSFGFFISSETKPIFNLFLGKVFSSKVKETCEVTLSTNNNLQTYVYLTGIVTQNEQQCLVTAIDINEHKREKERLLESEAKYQAIFESTGIATLIVEEDTTILMANNRCYFIMGYTPTEFIGQKWIQFVAPDCLKEMLKNHQLRRQNPDLAPKKYYVKLVDKKGEIRDACLDIVMIPGTKQSIVSMLDITELNLAQFEIREREVQYRNLANSGFALIWTSGADKLCNYFNEPWLKFTGRTLSQEMGDGWTESVHPDDLDRCLENYMIAFDKREAFTMEYRLRHVTGEYRWIMDMGKPNYNNNGEFIGYIGHCFDITERKQAEETLLINEKRYRTFIDSSSDYIFLKDEQLKHIVANKSYSGSYNKTENEIFGKTDFDLMSESFAVNCQASDKKAIATNSVVITEEKWDDKIFETVKFPIEYQKGKIGVGGFVRDITERKQLEKGLKASEKKYRNIVNWAPVGIYQTTTDGKFLSVNHRLTKILGYESIDELQRRNIETDIYLTPSECQSVIARFESSGNIFNHELRWKKKNGTPIWISLYAHVIKDKAGITQYFEGFVSDITERKRTEEALKESESRFRTIFGESPIVIWEEDFSGVKARFDELRQSGVTDFRDYLNQNPDEVSGLAARVQILEINQQSVKLLGVIDKEQVSRELLRYFTADSLEVFKEELIALADGKMHFQSEIPILNLQGKPLILDLLLAVQPGYKETLSRVLVSTMDITNRKRAEENLQISEKKYRELVDNALLGIYSTNLKGKFLFANNAMCKMLEYDSIDEFINADVISTYKNKEERVKFVEKIKNSKQIFDFEIELITKKGKTIDVIVNSFISGEVITGMMMDISDRKRTEEKIISQLEELQRWQVVTLGREDRNRQLKQEVNELLVRLGETIRYPSQESVTSKNPSNEVL